MLSPAVTHARQPRVGSSAAAWGARRPYTAFASQSATKPSTERKHIRSNASGSVIQIAAATWPSRVRRKSPGPNTGARDRPGRLPPAPPRAPAPASRNTARASETSTDEMVPARQRGLAGRRDRRRPVRLDEQHQLVGRHPGDPAAGPGLDAPHVGNGDADGPRHRVRQLRHRQIAAQRDHPHAARARVIVTAGSDIGRLPSGRGTPDRRRAPGSPGPRRPGSSASRPSARRRPRPAPIAIERPRVGEK